MKYFIYYNLFVNINNLIVICFFVYIAFFCLFTFYNINLFLKKEFIKLQRITIVFCFSCLLLYLIVLFMKTKRFSKK